MFKEVDVIFFVEHKDRELESIKLLVEKLNINGISSIVLSTFFHLLYLYFYRPKVVVFPYLMSQKDWPVELVYSLYSDNIKYINMNWEQLLFPINEEYKKPQDDFVRMDVLQISWSEEFKNNFLIKHGVLKDNISVTGNISNEILHNLLNKNICWKDSLSREFELNKNKKWIFMPMNYAWAFSSDKHINGKINAGYPSDKAWLHREYAQKCLKKFIYFINDITKRFDYEIIIRPHPSIIEEQYEELFKKEIGYIPNNVIFNKSYSIREWILASDIIGSSWSTSVWDAYNIGKPVFLFTPYQRPEWLNVWWNEKVPNLNKFDEEFLSLKIDKIDKIEVSKNIIKLISNMESETKKFKVKIRICRPKLLLLVLMRFISCKYFKCKIFKKYINSVKYDYFTFKGL